MTLTLSMHSLGRWDFGNWFLLAHIIIKYVFLSRRIQKDDSEFERTGMSMDGPTRKQICHPVLYHLKGFPLTRLWEWKASLASFLGGESIRLGGEWIRLWDSSSSRCDTGKAAKLLFRNGLKRERVTRPVDRALRTERSQASSTPHPPTPTPAAPPPFDGGDDCGS